MEGVTDAIRRAVVSGPGLPYPIVSRETLPRHVEEFHAWCVSNSVVVLAGWPVVLARPQYAMAHYLASFRSIAEMYGALGIRVLGSQEDFFVPLEEIFNTEYHANSVGRRRATQALARELKLLQQY
jgi:hypothetical protein